MKKLFITVAFVAAAMFAQAQFFIGGSLGLNMGSQTFESTKIEKTFGFSINPNFGFMFSDKMGVGIEVMFGSDKTTFPEADGDWMKTTTIGFAPYFRYVFAEVDNFRFYGDVKFGYYMENNKEKESEVKGNKVNTLGVNIVPGIQYNFTDNISMVAALNILRLGYNAETTSVYNYQEEKYEKTKETGIGFGINEATPLTVGFVYTF